MSRTDKGILTLYRTEAPLLVLAVVGGRSTPEETVFTADISAVVEPLVIVQEGEIAGVPVSIAMDCVNFWDANRENLFMMQDRNVCFVCKLWPGTVLNSLSVYVCSVTCTNKYIKSADWVTDKSRPAQQSVKPGGLSGKKLNIFGLQLKIWRRLFSDSWTIPIWSAVHQSQGCCFTFHWNCTNQRKPQKEKKKGWICRVTKTSRVSGK